MHQIRELSIHHRNQNMEMIWHDDELVDEVGFRMLLNNFRENDISHSIVFDYTFASALIEPCFDF